mmetsp:Transcript_6560/g.10378  ORF Transcript_6560/g.10378 Transcript_6560/m.10378 type:complete len:86 (+) Transcript_6560:319-576(+)
MSFLFGKKEEKDPKKIARDQAREMKKSERMIDREQQAMQRQEQQLIKDIKKAANVIFIPQPETHFAMFTPARFGSSTATRMTLAV